MLLFGTDCDYIQLVKHGTRDKLTMRAMFAAVLFAFPASAGEVSRSSEPPPVLDPHGTPASLFDGKTLGFWRKAAYPAPGEIYVQAGTLVLERGHNMTGITWTGPVWPVDYEINLQARRTAGSDIFCGLTFPIDGEFCSLICGGWGGVLVGLSCVDYRDADDNETGIGYEFEMNRWYTIRVRVTSELIEAWIDRDRVVELETAERTLSVRGEMDPCRPLGIATWRTGAAIRDIRLRKIEPRPRFTATEAYPSRNLAGWRVRVAPELVTSHSGMMRNTMHELENQLKRISNVVPEAALRHMQQVCIWVEYRDRHYPGTCYHPDGVWLQQRGYNPEKAGGVEIANAENFVAWSPDRPWMILHELAHAYHHQIIGHDHTALKVAFAESRRSGVYDQVRHVSGEVRRHPAKNSVMEYFARGTEAYFGTSSYYPFNRADLKKADPNLCQLLKDFYGVVPSAEDKRKGR
jgi:hypothetical protein